MIKTIRGTAALGLIATAACTGETLTEVPPSAQLVTFEQMENLHSHYSAFTQRERLVITNTEDWADAWVRFHGAVEPLPAVPAVDFSQRMVVLAAMGQRNTGGFVITVEGVYRDDDRLLVEVLETSPGPSCFTTAALTSPATAVITDRWDGDLAWVEKAREVAC